VFSDSDGQQREDTKMTDVRSREALARRSFLSRLVAGAGAFGAAFGGASAASAQSAGVPAPAFTPARHSEDDWFDQTSAKHRFFYDTTTAGAFGQALFFARNYFVANASGYKLTDADLAQVICMRHESTSFAFTDAMWAKYGAALSARAENFLDPKTKQVPTINVYLAGGYGESLKNVNVTIDQMAKRGVRFAVCAMATRAAAQVAAQQTGGNVDAIFTELTENLVSNGHMVPAGIVAVNRAQERGYSFSYVI
jgi:intracellular sulfur oxidation DsrE/DsrF family protein